MYSAQSTLWRPGPFIGTMSREMCNFFAYANTAPSEVVWNSAGNCKYLPLRLYWPYTIKRMWWLNGATVGTDTRAVALYSVNSQGLPSSRLLATGSVATAGANTIQFVTVTDTTIGPGVYYLAISTNGTTDTIYRWTNTNSDGPYIATHGFYAEASANPPPATATPANPSIAFIPLFGITNRASP